jgi:hypothetical protein
VRAWANAWDLDAGTNAWTEREFVSNRIKC